jgi:predicted phosphodiesterase
VKRAILSDIHGNLEALEAVLEDVRAQGVDEIFCLGDVVGYGPNPRECVSSGAERAIFWTREQLEMPNGDASKTQKRWEFLSELPRTFMVGPCTFVHGSVRNPLNEYVFPEDIYNARKLERIFALIERYCFQGHTHVPGVFTEEGRFLSPDDVGAKYVLPTGKAMINVGSVGQPRDMDNRSCYVVLTDQFVEFRRVPYPIERTMEKILSIPELDPFLAERLKEGR